jgi:accessory gene regulator B
MHITFLILRQVCFGYHFVNNIQCYLWSIILFPVLCQVKYVISANLSLPILFISLILLIVFAPVGTKKNPILNKDHRKYLRKKFWFRVIYILIISFSLPTSFRLFVALGVMIQTLMVLIQYFINKREEVSR